MWRNSLMKQVILNRKQYLRTREILKDYKEHFDYVKVEINKDSTIIKVEKDIQDEDIKVCLEQKLNIRYNGNHRFEDYLEAKLIKLAREVSEAEEYFNFIRARMENKQEYICVRGWVFRRKNNNDRFL